MHAIIYFFVREIFVNWSEKVHIYWLANSARLDTGLNAVYIGPLRVICAHLKHVYEVYVFGNLYYLEIILLIIVS